MWEVIEKDGSRGFDLIESARLKVPGGWIVRTVVKHSFSGTSVNVSQIFVSDQQHTLEDTKMTMNFSLKCFPFHKWGNWETIRTGDLFDTFWSGRMPVGRFIEQKKTCEICKKVKLRQEKVVS
jgi:hypothetical protein